MKRSKKLFLDIYNSHLGKGYLVYEGSALIAHYLPGSKKPQGDFIRYRKRGLLASKMEAYFEGLKPVFNDKIKMTGTDFEKRVYEACSRIPYGKTLSYKELALAIGSKGYRAVGKALAKNRLPVIIPCHRITASKSLGGWSGPKDMKQVLISLEGDSGEP